MARQLPYKEYEGDMVKAQLQKIEKYAGALDDMIHPEDEIEGWVQNKIARISTDIGDVKHYLDYQLNKMAEGGTIDFSETVIMPYKVAFKFERGEGEDEEEIVRIVTIHATSLEEAQEIATKKYSDYYDDFEIVTIEDGDDVQMKSGGMMVSTFQMAEARMMLGDDKWKRLSEDEKKDVVTYLSNKGLLDADDDMDDDDDDDFYDDDDFDND